MYVSQSYTITPGLKILSLAVIIQPNFSVDSLRARWGMTDQMHFMLGEDNDAYTGPNGQQETMANGGLWFLRNTEVTQGMLRGLIGCPEEVRHAKVKTEDSN